MGLNNSKVQELEQELEQIKKEREQSISLIQAKIDANNKLRQQNIEKEQLAIEEQKRADELAAKEALAIQEATIKKYNEMVEELLSTFENTNKRVIDLIVETENRSNIVKLEQLNEENEKILKKLEQDKYYSVVYYTLCLIYDIYFSFHDDVDEIFDLIKKRGCNEYQIFLLLCNFPTIIPIVYPTGVNDSKFHDYSGCVDINTNLNHQAYLENIFKPNFDEYFYGNMKQYIKNAVTHSKTYNAKKYGEDYRKIKDTLNEPKYFDQFFDYTGKNLVDQVMNSILKLDDYDYIHPKLFYQFSEKGICSKDIKLLPFNYPLYNFSYEIYESVVMICNLFFSVYGQIVGSDDKILTGNNQRSYNDIEKNKNIHLRGGKCFELSNTKNVYDTYYSLAVYLGRYHDVNMFEYTDIVFREVVTDVKKMLSETGNENENETGNENENENETGIEINETSETSIYKSLDNISSDGSNNFLYKYKNPTELYTYDFFNVKTMKDNSLGNSNILYYNTSNKLLMGVSADNETNLINSICSYFNFETMYKLLGNNYLIYSSIDYLTYHYHDDERGIDMYPILSYLKNKFTSITWYTVTPIDDRIKNSNAGVKFITEEFLDYEKTFTTKIL